MPERIARPSAECGLALMLLLLLLPALPGCAAPPTTRESTPPYLTIVLLDGLSDEVFRRELAAGRLPELARIIEEGAYIERGIGAVPSMTGYAFYPFLTGCDAAHSGVLGLRWVDRERERGNFRNYVGRTAVHMNLDLAAAPPTIFERLAPEYTSCWNSLLTRGATRSWVTPWRFSLAKYQDRVALLGALASIPKLGPLLVPDWQAAEENMLGLALKELERRPKMQWITFASLDGYQHVHGTDEGYAELLRRTDGWIGRYRRRCRELGQERVLAIVSDHGVEEVSRHLDLRAVLAEKTGLRLDWDHATNLGSGKLDDALERHARHDGFIAVNGDLMNWVYLRDPRIPGVAGLQFRVDGGTLRHYPTPRGELDLFAALTAVEGIELVAGLDPEGRVLVASARGRSWISADSTGYAYAVEGVDPLGYTTHLDRADLEPQAVGSELDSLLDGRSHRAEAWLAGTARTSYPYTVPRLWAAVHAHDAGDLFVTSAEGWDLGADFELIVKNYRGGHGGIRATQTRVPYLLVGPGVRPDVHIDAARAEDVGATLFALLGLDLPKDAEGRVLERALSRSMVDR